MCACKLVSFRAHSWIQGILSYVANLLGIICLTHEGKLGAQPVQALVQMCAGTGFTTSLKLKSLLHSAACRMPNCAHPQCCTLSSQHKRWYDRSS